MKKIISITIVLFILCLLTGSASSQDKIEKIKTGINEVYSIFNSGNFSGLEKYIEDNYVEHQMQPGQKPGREGLIETIKNFRTAFPDFHETINDIVVTEDKAAVLFTMTGTNTGNFMGMPATNKKISIMGIDYLYFNKDAKCIEHYGYQDDMAMMQQLGLMK